MGANLSTTGAILEGKYYSVLDLPFDPIEENGSPDMLQKGIAYRFKTDLTHGLFPYRGTVDVEKFDVKRLPVGLWYRKIKGEFRLSVIRPRNAREKKAYAPGQEKDILAAVLNYEYTEDQFADTALTDTVIGSDVYRPPVHQEDDFLSMLMKIGIRKKNAPLGPYGKRLEALAVDKTRGIEGANVKNNAVRALRTNVTMSPNKFDQYSDVWQFESAVILKDIPGSVHPALPPGKMFVIYPKGIPFDIDTENLVNIQDAVADAVSETNRNEVKRKTAEEKGGEEENDQ